MMATNHALAGALLGLSIGHPIALPLAFASHFALDSIPHYTDERLKISSKRFVYLLLVDAFLCFLLVTMLALVRPDQWLLAALCAFLATSPDFMWVGKFLRARRGEAEQALTNPIMRFHSRIQWFTRPVGAVVELVWLVGASVLLANVV